MRAVRKQTPERKIRSAFRRERLECMDPATFFHQDAEARGLACIRDLDELERVVMVVWGVLRLGALDESDGMFCSSEKPEVCFHPDDVEDFDLYFTMTPEGVVVRVFWSDCVTGDPRKKDSHDVMYDSSPVRYGDCPLDNPEVVALVMASTYDALTEEEWTALDEAYDRAESVA